MTPPEGEDFRFPGPLLRRMTAEQTWDSIVLLLRGSEIDQIKTDHAPSIERLVFPFEFENEEDLFHAILGQAVLYPSWLSKEAESVLTGVSVTCYRSFLTRLFLALPRSFLALRDR